MHPLYGIANAMTTASRGIFSGGSVHAHATSATRAASCHLRWNDPIGSGLSAVQGVVDSHVRYGPSSAGLKAAARHDRQARQSHQQD